jgi:hypothetical protein
MRIPLERRDLLRKRAEYELETEDDGRVAAVSAATVLELLDELERMYVLFYGPCSGGKAGDERGTP